MINLLPPAYKEELEREERFRLALILGLLLVLFLVCLSLALLSIRVYLSGKIQMQQTLVELQREHEGEADLGRVRALNADVAARSSFYENRIAVSDAIEQVSAAFPADVYVTFLSYVPAGGTNTAKIALRGLAPRTEDLLALRTNLENNPLFKNFSFPPTNWIRSENIAFSFEFGL